MVTRWCALSQNVRFLILAGLCIAAGHVMDIAHFHLRTVIVLPLYALVMFVGPTVGRSRATQHDTTPEPKTPPAGHLGDG